MWKINSFFVCIWIIAAPVIIAFIVVLAIGARIGSTTAITPPKEQSKKLKQKMRLLLQKG